MGAFDLWGWQFLWILGLWFGVRWAKGDLPVANWARTAAIPATLIFAVLLPLRYAVGRGVELGAFEPLFDKWHFGVVRLINFAAIAVLLIRFQSILKPLAVPPLVLLGQVLPAGVLRAPAVHVCGAQPAGQCRDAQRLATIGAAGGHFGSHAADGTGLLQVRGEYRAKR